jgi:DNA-binding NarL/FixJ family response regulator
VSVRVLVVDDQALVRASFRLLLETAGLEIAGEAGNGREAITLATRLRPDVVLMDVRMPELDGVAATRRICAQVPGVRVLILTTFDLDEYVYGALRAGASGFLLKDAPPADLLAAIQVVAAGDALLAPGITRRLIARFAAAPDPPAAPPALRSVTPREREVLLLVARGLSNREIAERLQLSPATVKTHIGRLLDKLAARDRAQLVIAAYESGLVAAGRQ